MQFPLSYWHTPDANCINLRAIREKKHECSAFPKSNKRIFIRPNMLTISSNILFANWVPCYNPFYNSEEFKMIFTVLLEYSIIYSFLLEWNKVNILSLGYKVWRNYWMYKCTCIVNWKIDIPIKIEQGSLNIIVFAVLLIDLDRYKKKVCPSFLPYMSYLQRCKDKHLIFLNVLWGYKGSTYCRKKNHKTIM